MVFFTRYDKNIIIEWAKERLKTGFSVNDKKKIKQNTAKNLSGFLLEL